MSKKGTFASESSLLSSHSSTQARIDRTEAEKQRILKRSRRMLRWIVGLACSLSPLLVAGCCFLMCNYGFIHKVDAQAATSYKTFMSGFILDGSFLWLSITLLAMTLVDLLLSGFNESLSNKTRHRAKTLLLISALLLVVSSACFFSNLMGKIIPEAFIVISFVVFIIFSVVSWYFTFSIMKES